ncbi:MAG: VWA domain-containing protein [Deltaproteobacteria bacterium]|nr:VWA domain-containing protein [Deltaproteobacteria bacterium]MBW2545681.1 VWA domain-containing protein [Deltaproteobacteria bacterium]MBW2717320.1 VWA domain-containing protein [Deltaproteobacteria bacterium]
MGKGKYADGNIELHVSIEENPDPPTLERWRKSFEVASRLLYHATDNQAHFAKVYLHTNGEGSADADATVSIDRASSYTKGHPTVILEKLLDPTSFPLTATLDEDYELEDLEENGPTFAEETLMKLGKDAFEYPFVIVHEFGHYAYALGDEYYDESTGKPTTCSGNQLVAGDPGEHACIMGVESLGPDVANFSATTAAPGYTESYGQIVEFCSQLNHDLNPDTMQNHYHDASCADAIEEYYQITIPPVGAPNAASLAAAPTVIWEPTTNGAELGFGIELAQMPGIVEDLGDPPDWAIDLGEYPALYASPGDSISLLSSGETEAEHDFELTSGVNETLERMRDALGGSGPRAAEVALVLFSTAEEKIQDARKLAASFAANGVRLFTIGVGRDSEDRDRNRASLQQLAQRTGGAYFEVDLKAGRKPHENTQLVRNHVAHSFDRLRYGAPVALLPRGELTAGETTFQVEEDSKSLKLVFTKTPGSQLQSVVRDGNGKKVGVRWTDSKRGGFRTAIIDDPKPKPGTWSVEVAPGAPPALDLAVYSKNPLVRLGVTGWRRLRVAGETVKLQVVVRAPVAVVDLDEAVVRVSPPGSVRSKAFSLKPRRDGVHVTEFPVTEVGAYDVEVLVRNNGNAVAAGPPVAEEPRVVERFDRTRRVQVHVTKLSDD